MNEFVWKVIILYRIFTLLSALFLKQLYDVLAKMLLKKLNNAFNLLKHYVEILIFI